ncbi:hypothetical protein D0812_29070 (plasmid) [Vibrio owensii]|uniref:Uncharacterized protein n=1 Tax=Vibrio owensii TaxID=696485 RepID=A0ABM6ZS20_9VIBR|nr:hypothetical protein D0812_29070 [Vibrio owensii]TOH12721.1 hypothetical protein CGI87_22485 [Vibrio parahaemolyticus]TOI05387.1 hypothetical protein CGI67_23475 [Vibrio parahaemolyticus]
MIPPIKSISPKCNKNKQPLLLTGPNSQHQHQNNKTRLSYLLAALEFPFVIRQEPIEHIRKTSWNPNSIIELNSTNSANQGLAGRTAIFIPDTTVNTNNFREQG